MTAYPKGTTVIMETVNVATTHYANRQKFVLTDNVKMKKQMVIYDICIWNNA